MSLYNKKYLVTETNDFEFHYQKIRKKIVT